MPHSASASSEVPSASVSQHTRYSSVRTVFPLRADAVADTTIIMGGHAIQGKTKTGPTKVVAINNAHTM